MIVTNLWGCNRQNILVTVPGVTRGKKYKQVRKELI